MKQHMKFIPNPLALLLRALLIILPFAFPAYAYAAPGIDIWWPADGAHMDRTQPFKALLQNTDVNGYTMDWQVDNGQLNSMYTTYQDYQHKEASVDLTNWTWRGSGPYKITFVAKQNGNTVATRSVNIYVDNALPKTTQTQTVTTSTQTVPTQPVAPVITSKLAGLNLFVDPNAPAAKQAIAWGGTSSDAQAMRVLANQPTATWLGGWSGNVTDAVSRTMNAAKSQGAVPTFVAYNIPNRDCGGGYSAGGVSDASNYASWISGIASGIGSGQAIVILEPDALAEMNCLSDSAKNARYDMLKNAISTLKKNAGTRVYLDAGHSGWVDAGVMGAALSRSGVSQADGFSLNVSNFGTTNDQISYGTNISKAAGGAHFVIDTSRNGNGSNGQWCNPSGRAIGQTPTTNTGNALVDAFLWIKTPGESDGWCNGGPSAGTWWPSYALSLVRNR